MGWLRPKAETEAGQRLFDAAVRQARVPAFYRDLRAPDTNTGRFELYTLHVVLLAQRLRGRGKAANGVMQALFDAYLTNLDIALRELGVGDVSVGKKMNRFGGAFYGRLRSWEDEARDETDLIRRTIYEGDPTADAGPMAAYVRSAREHLAAQPDSALLEGRVDWPQVVHG